MQPPKPHINKTFQDPQIIEFDSMEMVCKFGADYLCGEIKIVTISVLWQILASAFLRIPSKRKTLKPLIIQALPPV